MIHLFDPVGQGQLRHFLETDPLFVFDYDGTLSPIVAQAGQAQLRARTRELIEALCLYVPCVLLTGRSHGDAMAHVGDLPFARVVGSHGADWGVERPGDLAMRARVARWYAQLTSRLERFAGVEIENKGLSVSVHYRHAVEREAALVEIRAGIAKLSEVRVIGGKEVFNLLPEECAGKGDALRELKPLFSRSTALYAGDDLTDEEVFRLPATDRLFKIRVGRPEAGENSAADYYLESQLDMDVLLETLVRHYRVMKDLPVRKSAPDPVRNFSPTAGGAPTRDSA